MRLLAWGLLLFFSIPVFSQNCTSVLSGSVIDLHDGQPLSGATIIVAGPEISVLTDFDGNFNIPRLCDGTYSVQIAHPECDTKAFTVNVKGNTSRKFRLEHHLEELNQVIIKGKIINNKTETQVQSSISMKTLERFSGASLGDALNSLSGVSSLNTGNTVVKPIVNGLHSSRVVIINDGARMEDQEWGAEHAPNIDINTAGNITLIKGASALQYSGDAVGGIIITEAAKIPLIDSLYGKTIAGFSSNGRGSTITSALTKSFENGWYAAIQGSLKRFGDFETPDYVLSNTGVFEQNASVRLGLNRINYGIEGSYSIFKNEIGILRASHLGGAQDQVNAINSDEPLVIDDFTYKIGAPKQEVTHHLAKLKSFMNFSFGKLHLNYDFQRNNRFEFDIRRGDDADEPSVDLELSTHTLGLGLDSELSEKLDLKTGIVARYQNNFADPSTGVRRLIPDFEKQEMGIYAVADYEINENLLLETGVRFDYIFMDVLKFYRTSFWESRGYDVLFPEIVVEDLGDQILTNPELTFKNASATAGLVYEISDNNKIYINYSLATRSPNPSELFSEGLHHSASRIELGDLRFVPEVSNKFSATFQRDSEKVFFSINSYLNRISNFILIEPTGIQRFQVWEYRQTQAQLLGIDVDLNFPLLKNLQMNNQFSLVKGQDTELEMPLIDMPPASLENGLVYENSLLNNLRLSLQSQYNFRQNEFPNNNFEVFIPETESFELVDVSTPPPAYHLLNFSAEMDVYSKGNSGINLGISISNLFDTSYRNYLNRLRDYADDLGRNVSLSVKINY